MSSFCKLIERGGLTTVALTTMLLAVAFCSNGRAEVVRPPHPMVESSDYSAQTIPVACYNSPVNIKAFHECRSTCPPNERGAPNEYPPCYSACAHRYLCGPISPHRHDW